MSAAHRGRNTKHLYAGERAVTQAAGREQGGSQAEDSSLVNTRLQWPVSFELSCAPAGRRDEEGRFPSFSDVATSS